MRDKYQAKQFVNRSVLESEQLQQCDAWTVKRLRRRARSKRGERAASKGQQQQQAMSDKEPHQISTQLIVSIQESVHI